YSVRRILAGLTSRCTVPRRCAVSNAPATLTPMCSVSAHPTGPVSWVLASNAPCGGCAITLKGPTVGVLLHPDERPAGGGRPDLEDGDDVRVPGEFAHRDLLTHEPLEVVGLEIGGQHLHPPHPIELGAAAQIHNAHAHPA